MKTVNFRDPKYVGDPLNAVRIFNEKEADELIVLDIDASRVEREPDYTMVEALAAECRMPLCYGGGVQSAEQAQRICGLGVEKVALSTGALERPAVVGDMSRRIGQQSVVVVLDVKKRQWSSRYDVWMRNAGMNTKRCPVECAREFESLGAGEIVLNSIDNDGRMRGYDLDVLERVREAVTIPLTLLGGAGSTEDIRSLVEHFGIIGAAAGSLFVFKGVYRAVLINYPSASEKRRITSPDPLE